jgi:type II secretory pathway pseudopilin PulG
MKSKGFTLLEMLLTLSLCVVLMILVSGAMSFYVREMATAERLFRQSQIASAVLQTIEDDLRMTLTTRPIDTEPLAEVLASASSPLSALGISGAGGGSSDEEQLPEDPGLVDAEAMGTDDPLDAASLDLSLGGTVLQSPGLIGSATQLQVDVSRLPRLEETVIDPALAISNGRLLDRPSDIKTISYFVEPPGFGSSIDALAELATASGIASSSSSAEVSSGGLVRRELDRAIATQAATSGGLSRLGSAGELISPEVSAIQFEYFDMVNWMPFYSTDEMGFLPPLIRVTLVVEGDDQQPESARTFTHVIYLPMSHPEDAESEEVLDEEGAAEGESVASEGASL